MVFNILSWYLIFFHKRMFTLASRLHVIEAIEPVFLDTVTYDSLSVQICFYLWIFYKHIFLIKKNYCNLVILWWQESLNSWNYKTTPHCIKSKCVTHAPSAAGATTKRVALRSVARSWATNLKYISMYFDRFRYWIINMSTVSFPRL